MVFSSGLKCEECISILRGTAESVHLERSRTAIDAVILNSVSSQSTAIDAKVELFNLEEKRKLVVI